MDILVLILLFVLYLVPEIFKRVRKPPKYEYPEFPDEPTDNFEVEEVWHPPVFISPQPVAAPIVEQPRSITADQSEPQPFILEGWAYAYVMAEVVGQPRSLSRWHRK